jgi:spore coat protein CotH
VVHAFAVEFDKDDYEAMLEALAATGERQWISATVTIDGETFVNAGLRLMGSSAPRGGVADSDPAKLPWLITLDQFFEGQELEGYRRFVLHASSTETMLNDAVALDLLEHAALAREHAVAARFSVNGGEDTLHLVVHSLDGTWDEANVAIDGAEAGSDHGCRGEDPDARTGVLDQETDTDEGDLGPLIEFLEFINNSDDETFRAELGEHLDVEAFATYLAFEDLVANVDAIHGPGNNSSMPVDEETGGSTGDLASGGPGGSDVLVERFKADPDFHELYAQASAELRSALFESGEAQAVLDAWVDVLTEQAADLIDACTVQREAAAISAYFADENS